MKINLYDDETCQNHALNWEGWKKTSNPNDSAETDQIPDRQKRQADEEELIPTTTTTIPPTTTTVFTTTTTTTTTVEDHTFYNSEVEFCAGHYNMTTDTYTEASSCHGDSGGPLGTDRHFT